MARKPALAKRESPPNFRYATKAQPLAASEEGAPAHTDANRFIPAPAKVQAVVRTAHRLGLQVVSRAEFRGVDRIGQSRCTGASRPRSRDVGALIPVGAKGPAVPQPAPVQTKVILSQ